MEKTIVGVFAASAFALVGTAFAGDTIYAIHNASDRVGWFHTSTPGTWVPLGATTGQGGFISALAFEPLTGSLYGSNGTRLFRVNPNGSTTTIGPHNLEADRTIGGMDFLDESVIGEQILFAVDHDSTCSGASNIVEISTSTGAATFHCEHPDATCAVGLAVSELIGEFFLEDVISDEIYHSSIDFGACDVFETVTLPFDANFSQENVNDAIDGSGFLVAFNNTTFKGELWEWSPLGGTFTFLSDLGQGGAQMAGADLADPKLGCVVMTVTDMKAGQDTTWSIRKAGANASGVIMWSTRLGVSTFNNVNGYCVRFGLKGVGLNRIVGHWTADANGRATITRRVAPNATGIQIHSQAAKRNTCPDRCTSTVNSQVVQ